MRQPRLVARVAASTLLAATLLAAGCATSPPTQAAASTPAAEPLPEPADLPAATHAELRKRMQQHARAMNELVWAVLLLDYTATQRLAETIATNADLDAKAMDEATDVAQSLPKGFFTMMASLRAKSADLGRAAGVRDSRRMANIYGGLSQVCMDCHAVYRPEHKTTQPPALQ